MSAAAPSPNWPPRPVICAALNAHLRTERAGRNKPGIKMPWPHSLNFVKGPTFWPEPLWWRRAIISTLEAYGDANMAAHSTTETDHKDDSEADRQKERAELARLLERAEKGDCSVLPELRKLLDDNSRLWQGYGDLGLQAQGALIQQTAGTNLLMAQSLLRKTAAMKEELAGESAPPLERLLADRVVATWLDVNLHEALLAQCGATNEARSKLLERRQDAANRRHLAAVKMLATVRRLLTPARSPLEIATQLAGQEPNARRGREGIAGTVPVSN
jgi:phage gp37-like protein